MWAERGVHVEITDPADTKRAQRICVVDCPVALECAVYAVETGQQDGIWGGLGSEGILKSMRARHAEGRPIRREIKAHQDYLRSTFGEQKHEWPWSPASECERCGDPVPAGNHPPDRNPPGATCGKKATAVKGCKCYRCAMVNHERLLKQRSPGFS